MLCCIGSVFLLTFYVNNSQVEHKYIMTVFILETTDSQIAIHITRSAPNVLIVIDPLPVQIYKPQSRQLVLPGFEDLMNDKTNTQQE